MKNLSRKLQFGNRIRWRCVRWGERVVQGIVGELEWGVVLCCFGLQVQLHRAASQLDGCLPDTPVSFYSKLSTATVWIHGKDSN